MIDFSELEESLTDYFSRSHHGPATARQRAQDVVRIVKQHHVELEEEQPYLCGGKTFCLLGCEPEADA
jgi:hypothetical protein